MRMQQHYMQWRHTGCAMKELTWLTAVGRCVTSMMSQAGPDAPPAAAAEKTTDGVELLRCASSSSGLQADHQQLRRHASPTGIQGHADKAAAVHAGGGGWLARSSARRRCLPWHTVRPSRPPSLHGALPRQPHGHARPCRLPQALPKPASPAHTCSPITVAPHTLPGRSRACWRWAGGGIYLGRDVYKQLSAQPGCCMAPDGSAPYAAAACYDC